MCMIMVDPRHDDGLLSSCFTIYATPTEDNLCYTNTGQLMLLQQRPVYATPRVDDVKAC